MLSDILTVGDKVDVLPPESKTGLIKSQKIYVSQIMDIDDETTISIAMPYRNGLMYVLEKEVKYKLHFYTSKGLYQVICELESIYRENNAIIAQVKLISNLDKIQRRQYFRLECIHETEYRVITQEEMVLEDRLAADKFLNQQERAEARKKLGQLDRAWQKASITDLSGGGAKFISDYPLMAGDRIRIKLDFIAGGELKKMILGAVVIASGKHENRNDKFEHRVEFYDIGKADREDLIKYIFEQERRRRRNDKV